MLRLFVTSEVTVLAASTGAPFGLYTCLVVTGLAVSYSILWFFIASSTSTYVTACAIHNWQTAAKMSLRLIAIVAVWTFVVPATIADIAVGTIVIEHIPIYITPIYTEGEVTVLPIYWTIEILRSLVESILVNVENIA
jgi:hypothetical protein